MNTKGAKTTKKGSASVVLLDDQVIVCRLQGVITGTIVVEALRQTRELAERVQVHRRPSLLLDARKVVRPTSEARTKSKELRTFGFERVAVINGSRVVTMLGHYLVRAAGMGDYTKFFDREKSALAWLQHGDVKKQDKRQNRRTISAALVFVLAAATLIGWQLDVPALRAIVPTLKPMNPVTAIVLLMIALSMILMKEGWLRRTGRRVFVGLTALLCLLLGIFIITNHFFNGDVITGLLFPHRLYSGPLSGNTSLGAGVGLVCIGTILGLLLMKTRKTWQELLLYILSLIVFLEGVAVIVGAAFGFETLYESSLFFAMPLNTAIAFLIINEALVTNMPGKLVFPVKIIRWLYNYWQAIAVTAILVLTTGAAWHVTTQDVSSSINLAAKDVFDKVQQTISDRFSAYEDALNGYRGLFAASNDVAPGEFHTYFVNSGLSTNYPGFSAITFVAAVPDASASTFTAQTRARATAEFPKYKVFSIYPSNNNAMHYPILYTQPGSPTTTYGFDLSTERVRRETLEQARDSGTFAASGIINLNASRGAGAPPNYGFFLSQPIYTAPDASQLKTPEQRRSALQGFVITYFQNDRLFSDLLASVKDKNAKFTLSDTESGHLLYSSKAKNVPANAPARETSTLVIAGKTWRLNMFTSPTYGKGTLYALLPPGIFIGGLAVSTLAGALVLGQLRRRDQALNLAANMTEDLNSERNAAVATQQKDEAILSSIGDAVFAIDNQGRITLFNQACVRISGYTREEAIGRPYTEILQFLFERTGKINDNFIRQALAGHVTSMKNHTILIRKDGRHVAVADSAAPIRDARGTLLGVIVVFRDVSKEQELDRAKTEFVSLASHQLRTPLSAINWYGELLLNGDAGQLSKEQRENIQEIYDGNQRMIELVNSLLDVSRLDLGKLMNQPVPTDMKALVQSLEKELQTAMEGKHLQYVAQIQASLPKVLADPKLLRMIVQNYFSNAVKYTPEGGSVHLTMRVATERELQQADLSGKHEYVFFSVSDTGYGIPKAQQAKIFSKLFRADNVRALDVEGTGLGLYIVKEVVEKFGGRVWFTSVESAGSTFYAIFPFKTKADVAPKTENK